MSCPPRRASIVLLALCLAACADDSDATDGAEPQDGASAADLLGPDLALAGPRFKIHFDYRFDKSGFFTPARKQTLEAAALIWGRLLSDDFPAVPAGTPLLTRDPEMPTVAASMVTSTAPADDLLIFVGSSDLPGTTLGSSRSLAGLSGVADPTLQSSLDARFNGIPFQPWSAWISFDTMSPWFFDPTPDDGADVPAAQIDFISVALHEMGHCLGIGASPAFTSLVDTKNHTFIGAHAVAAYGGPVPLTTDDTHVANGTLSSGQPVLLDPSSADGIRYLPSKLDLAILQDLGYHP